MVPATPLLGNYIYITFALLFFSVTGPLIDVRNISHEPICALYNGLPYGHYVTHRPLGYPLMYVKYNPLKPEGVNI